MYSSWPLSLRLRSERVVMPEREARPLQQAPEARVVLVCEVMQASGQQVLADRPVRVPLGLVRVIAQALVDAALEQHQTTQAIARGLKVAGVGVPLLEPVVLVCPDMLDLEGPGAALRDEILEIGGQVALGVEPVR